MNRQFVKFVTAVTLIAVVISLVFAGCAKEEAPVEEWQWPEDFKIGTHGVGASDYAQMTAVAPIIEQSTGMKVRIVPEDSSALKSRWIVEGVLDAKTESAGEIATFNMEATGGYLTRDGGPFQARAFAQSVIQTFGVMVRGDSEIRTVYDIKPGTKMSVWTMPGGLDVVKGVLAWANLSVDDVILVETGSYPDNMRMISDGRADVCCLALPSSTTVEELEAAPQGLHWLDLNREEDPEGAARFNTILPAHMFAPITIGVPSSIGHWGWGSASLLWTTADADPELIYRLVKWLDENYDSYKDLHPNNTDMSLDRFRVSLDIMYLPVHEGAIRYLEEKGMWTEEDDDRQAYNVDLLTRYIEAYQDAIDLADETRVSVDPENEEWIELWENFKEEHDLPIFKVMTDKDITEALQGS